MASINRFAIFRRAKLKKGFTYSKNPVMKIHLSNQFNEVIKLSKSQYFKITIWPGHT